AGQPSPEVEVGRPPVPVPQGLHDRVPHQAVGPKGRTDGEVTGGDAQGGDEGPDVALAGGTRAGVAGRGGREGRVRGGGPGGLRHALAPFWRERTSLRTCLSRATGRGR